MISFADSFRQPGLTTLLPLWLQSWTDAQAARKIGYRSVSRLSEGTSRMEATISRRCDDAFDVDSRPVEHGVR